MIVSIVIAILALSLLIFVHELFHFLIAKASSIDVPVFSIGFGPKLFSFKRRDTEFRIAAIPFGGYVQLKGMEPDDMKGGEDEFYSKNSAVRIATIFGGPFANVLFGFLICLSIFCIAGIEVPDTNIISKSLPGSNLLTGDVILEIDGKEVSQWYDVTENLKNGSEVLVLRNGKKKMVVVDTLNPDSLLPRFSPVIGMVYEDGPAYRIGLREGARVLKIDGEDIECWSDITGHIYPAIGDSLSILYYQDGDTTLATIIPEEQPVLFGDSIVNRGMVGIGPLMREVKISFSKAFSFASQRTWFTGTLVFKTISLLINRKVSARNLAGPIGIVMMTEKSLRWGVTNLLFFIALISVNLGIVNLIPIPPLDGFHIVVSIVSVIVRRKPSKEMMKIISTIGTIILLGLMVLIVFNDILRIFSGGM